MAIILISFLLVEEVLYFGDIVFGLSWIFQCLKFWNLSNSTQRDKNCLSSIDVFIVKIFNGWSFGDIIHLDSIVKRATMTTLRNETIIF